MKKLSILFILFSLAACKYDLPDDAYDGGAAAVPMEELNVPNGFDFGTARTVKLNVSAKDAQGNLLSDVPFTVSLPDGDNYLEMQTASTGQDGTANLEISLPYAVTEILLKTPYLGLPAEKLITVGSSSNLDILLGEENKEGFEGDLDEGQFVQGGSNDGTSSQATGNSEISTRSGISFSYMGNYNGNGRPNYLVSPSDVVKQDVLEVINASLPEGQPVPDYHPEYLDNKYVSTVTLVEDAQVWITFVHEGAGFRNALGYYEYETNDPPKDIDDIDKFRIIFPNVSYNGSGGQLATGNKVYLGEFEKGTSIGWFLVPDGWNPSSRKVDVKSEIKFSDKYLNTFTTEQYRQHVALLYDQSLQKLILGMEDISRPGGDNDFNDAVFYVTANPFTAVKTDNLPPADNKDDDDEDGVSNSVDVEPNNPEVAFYSYTSAQGTYGTLSFEDLYPNRGDYDLNDLVVDYNIKESLNAKNDIVKIEAMLRVMAAGSVQENGFGLELGIKPDLVASVKGQKVDGASLSLAPNGVENNQDKAVIIAFDKSLSLLGGGTLINTENGGAKVDPVDMLITITLKQPVSRQDLGTAPYNPFMFVNGLRGKEVHLAGYRPTSLANKDFFGSGEDATNPDAGIYYQTKTGLPFAINIPISFTYPIERVPVNAVHLRFSKWVESGGKEFTDWYKVLDGYQTTSKLYIKG